MSNETYIDLEQEYNNQKNTWSYHDSYETDLDRFLKQIKEFASQYPNDADLGANIRKFINKVTK